MKFEKVELLFVEKEREIESTMFNNSEIAILILVSSFCLSNSNAIVSFILSTKLPAPIEL